MRPPETRPRVGCLFLLLATAAAGLLVACPAVAPAQTDLKTVVQLTSDIVRKGMRLLPPSLVLINIENIEFSFGGLPGGRPGPTALEIDRRIKELTERRDGERNDILRQHLAVMLDRLQADKERNALLRQQNQTLRLVLDHQIKAFNYQKERDDSLLRKLEYDVPADKLVVVVADFSSGNPDEGREVADEISHHLLELTRIFHGFQAVFIGAMAQLLVVVWVNTLQPLPREDHRCDTV